MAKWSHILGAQRGTKTKKAKIIKTPMVVLFLPFSFFLFMDPLCPGLFYDHRFPKDSPGPDN